MIDDKFVTALVAATKQKPELIDIGYHQKALVVDGNVTLFNDPSDYKPVTLSVSTLQSIVDYVAANLAGMKVVIHVAGPAEVRVVAPVYGDTRQSFAFAVAVPSLPQIHYGAFLPLEQFIIQLQSGFEFSDEREQLQRVLGSVKAASATELKDDGVSQSASVSTGVTRVGSVAIKSQWMLSPFRSFPEIAPPISPFIMRMQQRKGANDQMTAEAALYEADGGAWRVKAITEIGDWLKSSLKEANVEGVPVLA